MINYIFKANKLSIHCSPKLFIFRMR